MLCWDGWGFEPNSSSALVLGWGPAEFVLVVPDNKSRNIPEVVVVRRRAGGVRGIREGWVNRVKGGANGVSLQAT